MTEKRTGQTQEIVWLMLLIAAHTFLLIILLAHRAHPKFFTLNTLYNFPTYCGFLFSYYLYRSQSTNWSSLSIPIVLLY